ncbi:F0F1 ATP synthase subunit B [Candidatus Gracilibacteria bacterium]|nr:F0F1 ATP synthase subunit B [Candidatus Gracilibacteria bacterium]
MDIQLGAVVAQLLNFAVLVGIFYYFLGSKITAFIEERRNMMNETANAEEAAKLKLEEAEKEKEEILKQAREHATEIEANAEELAKQNSKKLLDKTEQESQYMLDSARTQIEKEQLDMENSMKGKVMNLALKLNERIFKKSDVNKAFIETEYDLITK